MAAELFHALGDPTRLEIVRRLSTGTLYTISTISEGLEMSRQGIRKHLQVLADVNIIVLKPKGRDTYIQLEARKLREAQAFIAELEAQWSKRLERLRDFVDDEQ